MVIPAPRAGARSSADPAEDERPDYDKRRPDFRAFSERLNSDFDPTDRDLHRMLIRVQAVQLMELTRIDTLHRDVEAQASRLIEVERRLDRIEHLLHELVTTRRRDAATSTERDAQR